MALDPKAFLNRLLDRASSSTSRRLEKAVQSDLQRLPVSPSRGPTPQRQQEIERQKKRLGSQTATDKLKAALEAIEEGTLAEELEQTHVPRSSDPATSWAESGEWETVDSSNVAAISYDDAEDRLFVEYKDGSLYQYEPVSRAMAMDLFNASSKGSWVWDRLRVRGTIFGYQIPYSFLSGASRAKRKWMATAASRKRHGEVPRSGRNQGGEPIQPEDLHRS